MRILVADDHELLRDTLVCYLETEAAFDVESVGNYHAAVEAVRSQRRFDLVLLDFNMPGMAGLDGLTEMLTLNGGQRVALISGVASRDVAIRALSAGAAGFLPKTLSAQALVEAVQQMSQGLQFIPPEISLGREDDTARHNPVLGQLSQREYQVWSGLAQGKSNKEIARDLDVRESTVKLHVKTLYRKLGVANRTQAALVAKEAGIY